MSQAPLSDRRNTILMIVLTIGLIFTIRLMFIQVISGKWVKEAQLVSEANKSIQPSRGLLFDRNGVLLSTNKPAYELWVTPSKTKPFDTLELCQLIELDYKKFITKFNKLSLPSNRRTKQSLTNKVPQRNLPKLQAILYRYPGFEFEVKASRHYPQEVAAHIMGYISEVDSSVIKKFPYYHSGDIAGKSGLEKYYENKLRGKRGKNEFLRDAFGNLKEMLSTDSAEVGKNITTSIDIELQKYGELLMQNKIGSIVAIEPSTGEILAMVSAPSFNPNLLTGDTIGKSYMNLIANDSLKPLFNRPLQSQYPPGSIFKMVQGLISVQVNAIDTNTSIPCNKDLVGCHNHPTARTLSEAIKFSCNPYFFQTLGRLAYVMEGKNVHEKTENAMLLWNEYVKSFGLGNDLKIDLPYYAVGNIPSKELYDRMYPNMNWNYRTINSISIGQGEMMVTPIQMANLAAVFANRGYFYYPHFVKKIGDSLPESIYLQKNYTKVDQKYFPLIANAMQQVVEGAGGTARLARINGITICGKTGTAQNPHGEDHSVFIAFAPKENPKIAISVYIENAGFGGTWAAPTASLMIEQYLTDTIQDKWKEKRILDANLIPKSY